VWRQTLTRRREVPVRPPDGKGVRRGWMGEGVGGFWDWGYAEDR